MNRSDVTTEWLLFSHAEIRLKVSIKSNEKRNLQHKRNKLGLRCHCTYVMIGMLRKRNLSLWLPRSRFALGESGVGAVMERCTEHGSWGLGEAAAHPWDHLSSDNCADHSPSPSGKF